MGRLIAGALRQVARTRSNVASGALHNAHTIAHIDHCRSHIHIHLIDCAHEFTHLIAATTV
jgi:hypothetical protein